jgi:pimeloyl-ACP methyl ester carboxylesterase
MATAVVREHAVATLPEEQQLVVPGVAREGPAVREQDGLALAEVAIEDLGAVLGDDLPPGAVSFSLAGSRASARPSTTQQSVARSLPVLNGCELMLMVSPRSCCVRPRFACDVPAWADLDLLAKDRATRRTASSALGSVSNCWQQRRAESEEDRAGTTPAQAPRNPLLEPRMQTVRRLWLASLLFVLACEGAPQAEQSVELAASESALGEKPSLLLVHGAWADGSGFQFVIPLLERAGYTVTAAQLPLTSVAEDVAVTRRMIDSQPGDVILVAHSYGGVAISAASYQNPKVRGLVYLASFAPDDDEILGELLARVPGELTSALLPDVGGFLYIDRTKFGSLFANGVLPPLARVLAAAQKPISSHIFAENIEHAGWRDVPSYYLVSTEDRTIPPALQRFMAERIGATTEEIDAGHLAFISNPLAVARFVLRAARTF